MDAGKIMWSMYENPEEKFEDMAADFLDIRKRVYNYPKMGNKAFFVAIPTSFWYRFRGNSICHHH